ncbi:hypothetical protein, partial [Vibrio splendidus]|uniref:hypothetical protein n=1 Tax=Vibrio splendidus TaxID=29497 RepID=UPI000D425EF3
RLLLLEDKSGFPRKAALNLFLCLVIFEDHRKETIILPQLRMTIFIDIEQLNFEIEIAISLG